MPLGPTSNGNVTLEQLLETALDSDDVPSEGTLTKLQADHAPTDGRLGKVVAGNSTTFYLGDGSSWNAVPAAVGLAVTRQRLTPIDVTTLSSPANGDLAHHDGSGANTAGPASYVGGTWTSLVDGTTIS